jgi:hypothetical protein
MGDGWVVTTKNPTSDPEPPLAERTPGAVLRDLNQTQDLMRKARKLVAQVRSEPLGSPGRQKAVEVGWTALAKAHKLLAEIPLHAADDAVLLRQLAVQRYATALLVRLRRLTRNEAATDEGDDADDDV